MFPRNDSPWVARPHLLQTDYDLEKIGGVDWVHGGLHGKMLAHFEEMEKIAGDYEIVFDDGKVIPAVDRLPWRRGHHRHCRAGPETCAAWGSFPWTCSTGRIGSRSCG